MGQKDKGKTKMRGIYIAFLSLILLVGCQTSHITIPRLNTTGFPDANTPIELWGKAAEIWIQQVADNTKTTEGHLSDLFKYNSLMFLILFFVFLGGIAFAVLTKSSWGWVIPTVAGGGLLALVFIVQAVEYIKWIILGVVIITLGLLIWKAWEYQKERNVAGSAKMVAGLGKNTT